MGRKLFGRKREKRKCTELRTQEDSAAPQLTPAERAMQLDALRVVDNVNGFDVADWATILRRSARVRNIPAGWHEVLQDATDPDTGGASPLSYTGCEALVEDVFHALHKERPTIRDEVPQEVVAGQQVMHAMQDAEEWRTLHESTVMDPIGAAMAVVQIEGAVAQQLVEVLQQAEKQQDGDGQDPQQQQGGQDQQGGDAPPQANDALRKAMQQAADAGNGDATKAMAQLAGGGQGKAPPSPSRELRQAQIEMAARMLDDDRSVWPNVLEQLGRFIDVAEAAVRSTMMHQSVEIVDLTMSDDIARALPDEVARLFSGDEAEAFIAFMDMTEGRLVSRGAPRVTKAGPVIMLLDESGSMEGQENATAKAIALATVYAMRRRGRPVWAVPFSSRVGKPVNLSAGVCTPEHLADFVESFLNGGTKYAPALSAALDLVESSEHGLRKADILMISDGAVNDKPSQKLQGRMRALRERHGVRYVELFVGSSTGGYARGAPEFVDDHIDVDSLARDDRGTRDALEQVWQGFAER